MELRARGFGPLPTPVAVAMVVALIAVGMVANRAEHAAALTDIERKAAEAIQHSLASGEEA